MEEQFLESAAHAEASGAGQDGGASFMSFFQETAWRGLVAATAMRHALDRPGAAAAGGTGTGPGTEAWRAALARNELALLQRQVHRLLLRAVPGPPPDADAALSALLAADWVGLSEHLVAPALRQELKDLAAAALAQAPAAPAAVNGVPARETAPLLGAAPVALRSGGGVAAAVGAEVRDASSGGALPLARCPATLRLCGGGGGGGWNCRMCGRAYAQPGGGGVPPVCVLCGGLVGPSGPPIMLLPPCQ
jgi:hypothetical protein